MMDNTREPIIIDSIEVHFPYKPYGLQLDYIRSMIRCCQQKQNGLLESPTGTGKTLCILCSSLAWIRYQRLLKPILRDPFDNKPEVIIIDSPPKMVPEVITICDSPPIVAPEVENEVRSDDSDKREPQIVYTSRTHSQLSQSCRQLKQTAYRTEEAVVLASREQLCLCPQVQSQSGPTMQSQMCSKLAKHDECQYYPNVQKKVDKHIDKYYKSRNGCKVMDIEDLVDFGRQHECCPYYSARKLADRASVLFMPYNYVIEPRIRHAMKAAKALRVKDSVIIFDEGHNVEDRFEEAMSTHINRQTLDTCIKQLHLIDEWMQRTPKKQVNDKFKSDAQYRTDRVLDMSLKLCELQKNIVTRFVAKFIDKPSTNELFELLDESGFDYEAIGSCIGFLGFMYELCGFHGIGTTSQHTSIRLVKDFFTKIYPKWLTPEKLDDYKHDLCLKYKLYFEIKDTFQNMWVFNVWCMSPSVGAKELMAEGVHSMIITSGTLAPIHSFELEMDMKFKEILQNNHIIGANQLSIVTIGESKDNVMLSSNYKNRDKEEYVRALGQTLVDVFKATPKGILVFFSSYKVLNKCAKLWTQLCVWEELNAVKRVFLESQNKLEFNKAFERYKQTVDNGFSNGAAFMGVFRGKLSEGIDLPDDYCRAVVMTGLPYPAVFDPQVMLKKKYLTEAQIGLTPYEWYALQMKRALNQAIGRVIRHKDDYGVIVLLDSRFDSLSDGLSKWIEKFIKKQSKNNINLNQKYANIRQFFNQFKTSNYNINDNKSTIDVCKRIKCE